MYYILSQTIVRQSPATFRPWCSLQHEEACFAVCDAMDTVLNVCMCTRQVRHRRPVDGGPSAPPVAVAHAEATAPAAAAAVAAVSTTVGAMFTSYFASCFLGILLSNIRHVLGVVSMRSVFSGTEIKVVATLVSLLTLSC